VYHFSDDATGGDDLIALPNLFQAFAMLLLLLDLGPNDEEVEDGNYRQHLDQEDGHTATG
jgi:hypothetical protein